MKSQSADFAALATLRYLDDFLVKLAGEKHNDKRNEIIVKLNKLNFDLYHVLPGRKDATALQYSLVDWRMIRVNSVKVLTSQYLKNPKDGELSAEAHAQILKWGRDLTADPVNTLIAANLSLTIEKTLLLGKKLQPLHTANLV